MTNTMISTSVCQSQISQELPEVAIVTAEGSDLQSSIANQVKAHLSSKGVSCNLQVFSRMTPSDLGGRLCILLPEIEKSLLLDPSKADYARIKSLLDLPTGLLWITSGAGQTPTRPDTGMILGLSRCVRSEESDKKLVTLALEDISDVSVVARHIINIVEGKISTLYEKGDNEYQEQNGKLCISRLIEANYLNDYVFSKTSCRDARQEKLDNENRALALKNSSSGTFDTLVYIEDPETSKPLAEDEIEVKVKAVGLTSNDTLTALGRLPESSLGYECAGIVTRAGSSAGFVSGDRVCALAPGTFKTRVRSKARTACRIPDTTKFREAVALPIAYVTAFHAVCDIAKLAEGDSILIHSGAGAVGQAAIQVSQYLDAEIFVTVDSEEEKKLVMDLYALTEDHIFPKQGLIFCNSIQRITKDRGVNAVLNDFAGEGLKRSWDCLAAFGSLIDIGKKNIASTSSLPMFTIKENCRYARVDVLHMISERPRFITQAMDAIMALLKDTKIRLPQPLRIYDSPGLEEAFRNIQDGGGIGKSVVEFDENDMVMVGGVSHSFECLADVQIYR